MNEKERIIELVRQKIISMDEALRLLEAGGTAKDSLESTEDSAKTNEIKIEGKTVVKDDLNRIVRSMVNQAVNAGTSVVKEVAQASNQVVREVNDSLENRKETNDRPSFKKQTSNQVEQASYQAKAEAFETKGQAIQQEIEDVNERLHQFNEEKIIIQQRLRELEILAEIEELTAEMKEQVKDLTLQEGSIDSEIDRLEQQVEGLYDQQENLYEECKENQQADPEFKRFISNSTQVLSEQAHQFKEEASREGKRLGKQVKDLIKSSLNNFTTKDVNVSFNVPWIKSQTLDHTFTFDGEALTAIDFNVLNGDLQVEFHEGDDILVEASIKFIGGQEKLTVDLFKERVTITTIENKLVFHVDAMNLAMDAKIKLPHKLYHSIILNTLNGDIRVKQMEADNLIISSKRGDIHLADTKVDEVNIDTKLGDIKLKNISTDILGLNLVNGDVKIKNSTIQTTSLKNINGDFRIVGPVGNIKANTVNGDCYITKKDIEPANISLSAVHGDLKISLLKEQAFTAQGKLSEGEVKYRMSGLDREEIIDDGKSFILKRPGQLDSPEVQIDASITFGDVYLKDGDSETGKEDV
ncbi:DUF4097 family beta strand repeat-containing protein [Facklamia sp. 7083-14-GEN3]|uniref:DUF4097 family beta strand repeat-containing protein n=1 Tax=Facklamia sp. 7083-14-GEN3 TaxID=2973478 RepID=UPI00215D36C3|nr:DUF4097 family beta strand repeat-containing protein [Facklamia sp. 7083-14-GEN3]MCR8969639.1 DUF4097 family beta strand repeat-containing protein [Facklamia sp. 7083-14-GEN3]